MLIIPFVFKYQRNAIERRENIAVAKQMTEIPIGCFKKCTSIEEIIIPNTINSLNNECFEGCSNIKKIIIMSDNTKLTKTCFNNVTNLNELTIPITLSTVADEDYGGTHPFKGCEKLTKVNFTKGTNGVGFDYLDNYASGKDTYHTTPWYYSKDNEIEVTFEDGITHIGDYMFCGCTKIKPTIIPDTVISIGTACFKNCAIFDTDIPNTVIELGASCFEGCTILTTTIPKFVTKLGASCFKDCTNLTEVIIPETLIEITDGCFKNCTSIGEITEIIIPETITKLGADCFTGCSNITKIEIKNDQIELSKSCFNNVTNLDELTIPITLSTVANVDYGGTHPFKGCEKITKINFTKGTNGVGFDYLDNYASGKDTYHATPWYYSKNQEINVILEKGINHIGNFMFCNCTGLTRITYDSNQYTTLSSLIQALGNDNVSIGNDAFTGSGIR